MKDYQEPQQSTAVASRPNQGDAALIQRVMQIQHQMMLDRLPWVIVRDNHAIDFRMSRGSIAFGNYGCVGISFVLMLWMFGRMFPPREWSQSVAWIVFLCWSVYLIRSSHISQWRQFTQFSIDSKQQTLTIAPTWRLFRKSIPLAEIAFFLYRQQSEDTNAYISAVLQDGREISLGGSSNSHHNEYGVRALGFVCQRDAYVRNAKGDDNALPPLHETELFTLKSTLVRAASVPVEPGEQLLRPIDESAQSDPSQLLKPSACQNADTVTNEASGRRGEAN